MSIFLMFGKSGHFTCTACKATWRVDEGQLEMPDKDNPAQAPCAVCWKWLEHVTRDR